MLIDGVKTDYFILNGPVPDGFTPVVLEKGGQSLYFALKICPNNIPVSSDVKLEMEISQKLWLPSLVSLIKAAHLTLFELFGYRYIFTAAGRFIGYDALGTFFLDNHLKRKSKVIENAAIHFRAFKNMVRPVISHGIDFDGTLSDKKCLICFGSSNQFWASIIFLKVGLQMHSVIIPTFSSADSVPTFLTFLKNDLETLSVSEAYYDQKEDVWKVSKTRVALKWPKEDGSSNESVGG